MGKVNCLFIINTLSDKGFGLATTLDELRVVATYNCQLFSIRAVTGTVLGAPITRNDRLTRSAFAVNAVTIVNSDAHAIIRLVTHWSGSRDGISTARPLWKIAVDVIALGISTCIRTMREIIAALSAWRAPYRTAFASEFSYFDTFVTGTAADYSCHLTRV